VGSGDTTHPCVLLSDHVACPGAYADQSYVYGVVADDTRDCECECDPPSGECSGGELQLFNYDGCGGTQWNYPLGGCIGLASDPATDHDAYVVDAGDYAHTSPCPVVELHQGVVSFDESLTLCCSDGTPP
jgi:hypothetical protein